MSTDSLATVDSAVLSKGADEKQTDFYQILGLNEDASYPEIKKKWLKLSMLFHPDKCGGDNEKYRQINLAYKVLSNPENRKKYNDSLAKTFNQLKDEERDVSYHPSNAYMDGHKFDRDAFFNDFEKSRSVFKKDLPDIQPLSDQDLYIKSTDIIPKVDSNDINRLLEARSNQLQEFNHFQENLRSDTFNPAHNPDNFNFIFSQYQKFNNRTDLEEIVVDTDASLSQYQDTSGFFKQDAMDANILRQLNDTLLSRQTQEAASNAMRHADLDDQELKKIQREHDIQRTNMMLERMAADRLAMEQEMTNNQFNYQIKLNESLLYTSDIQHPTESQ
jgi:curved DNA-binding protein CbpA